MMGNLISILVGGFITWGVSWYLYKRAGKELMNESAELRRLTSLVLTGMETAGLLKLDRDKSGKISGIIVTISGLAAGSSKASASLTTTDPSLGN